MTERRAPIVGFYVSGEPPVRFNASRAASAAGFAWPGKQGPRLMVAEPVEANFLARWGSSRRGRRPSRSTGRSPAECM